MIGDDETLYLKSGVDFLRLSPCKNSFILDIYRATHRIAHYKRASNAIFESPKSFDLYQGWENTEDNNLTLCRPWGPMDPKMKFDLALLRTDSKHDFHVT